MMKKVVVLGLCLLTVLSTAVWADTGPKPLTLLITNQDLALVQEVRHVTIAQGGAVATTIDNIPKTVQSESLQVRSLTAPAGFRLLSSTFLDGKVTVQDLLSRFTGKEIEIAIPDPKGSQGSLVIRKARLIANDGRPIFAVGGKIYIGEYKALWLPEMPSEMRTSPAFMWTVANEWKGPQDILLSYLVRGMSWRATGILTLSQDESSASMLCSAQITNDCGRTFQNAMVTLLAGKLRTVPKEFRTRSKAVAALAPVPTAFEGGNRVKERKSFEYHLYQLERPVHLDDKRQVNLTLFQRQINCIEKRLVSYGDWGGRYRSMHWDKEKPQPVTVQLHFVNSVGNGLGLPVPAGRIEVFKRTGEGSIVFLGEDQIDHTPVGAKIGLTIGYAFDVRVSRKQLSREKIGKGTIRSEWQLKVENRKDKLQTVELVEQIPGDWVILESSRAYEKIDAQHIRFRLNVPPGTERLVRYSVEVTHY